jgi:hypothetical protein
MIGQQTLVVRGEWCVKTDFSSLTTARVVSVSCCELGERVHNDTGPLYFPATSYGHVKLFFA